jgi:7-cyano-7-deazaguanine synthase
MFMKKAIILFSGGMDSVTTLYWTLKKKYTPIALYLNYFNGSDRERKAARAIAESTKIILKEIPVDFIKQSDDLESEGMKLSNAVSLPSVYVPSKNLLFTSIAAYYAEIFQADIIIQGLLAIDLGKYPDNSLEYFAELEAIIRKGIPSGTYKGPRLEFPLKELDKAGVIKLALELGVPFELTWSCYTEGEGPNGLPCGKCKGCIERADGFKKLGKIDPLIEHLKKRH